MKHVLITGGSGKLGAALFYIMDNAHLGTRENFDFTNLSMMENFLNQHPEIKTIIHCGALVSPPKVNEQVDTAIQSNIIGSSLLSIVCHQRGIRLIYISTDYVFSGEKGNYTETDNLLPQNKYAWSKLGGEAAVQMLENFVIIRLSFGPDEFPYKAAFIDQYTSREPVSKIIEKIKKIAVSEFKGVIHIGANRKSVFEYAQSIGAKQVDQISIKDMSVKMPVDTSLNTSLYKSIFE